MTRQVNRTARRVVAPTEVPVLPGSSAAVVADGLVFTGAMLAYGPDHQLHQDAWRDPDSVASDDPIEIQSEVLLANLRTTLAEAGADIGRDVARIWQWVVADYPSDADYAAGPIVWPPFPPGDGYVRVARRYLDGTRTSTGIGVRELPLVGGRFAVEVLAGLPGDGYVKQGYPDTETDRVLPFVSTLRMGDLVTTAAGASDMRGDWNSSVHLGVPSLVARDARVNPYIWLGSEIETQTEWTLEYLTRSLERAGTDLASCIHADVTICDPSDYAGFERVWRRWFPDNPPARRLTTGARIVVKGVRVEIGVICAADRNRPRSVHAADVTPPVGHAPHAARAGQLLFISSRLPLNEKATVPETLRRHSAGALFRKPAFEQAQRIFNDIAGICTSADTRPANVCKVQLNLADLRDLPDVLDAWRLAYPVDPPALSVLGMGGRQPLLAPHALVQADAVAWVPPQDDR